MEGQPAGPLPPTVGVLPGPRVRPTRALPSRALSHLAFPPSAFSGSPPTAALVWLSRMLPLLNFAVYFRLSSVRADLSRLPGGVTMMAKDARRTC